MFARRERAALFCARVALDTPACGRITASVGANEYVEQRLGYLGGKSRESSCESRGTCDTYNSCTQPVPPISPRSIIWLHHLRVRDLLTLNIVVQMIHEMTPNKSPQQRGMAPPAALRGARPLVPHG